MGRLFSGPHADRSQRPHDHLCSHVYNRQRTTIRIARERVAVHFVSSVP